MKHKTAGFSLVEMVIVIIISGILLVPFYTFLMSLTKARPDEDRLKIMQYGIGEYLRIHGQYPCPAKLDLSPSSANYASGDDPANPGKCLTTGLLKMKSPAGTDEIYVGAVPVDDLAIAMDCMSDPNDPGHHNLPDRLNQVFKKNIHWIKDVIQAGGDENAVDVQKYNNQSLDKTRCPTGNDMIDKYGDKYVYAVSANATDITTYDPAQGAVRIYSDSNDASTALMSGAGNNQDQVYAIFGMGADRAGATKADGTASSIGCGSGPGRGGAYENSNCQLGAGGTLKITSRPQSLQPTADYFDDEVTYSLAGNMSEEDFWSWNKNPVAPNPNNYNILFNPKSRLIIDTPEKKGGATPSVKIGDTTDKLIVNGGNGKCRTSDDGLCVQNDGTFGGSISADQQILGKNIEAPNASPVSASGVIETSKTGSIASLKYCYKPHVSTACCTAGDTDPICPH